MVNTVAPRYRTITITTIAISTLTAKAIATATTKAIKKKRKKKMRLQSHLRGVGDSFNFPEEEGGLYLAGVGAGSDGLDPGFPEQGPVCMHEGGGYTRL